ncbi:MAG: hypothetical protein ACREOI_15745 [bacterium]
MTGLMTLLTGLSLAALAALSIYRLIKEGNWRLFIIQMLALALCFSFLRALFSFPNVAPPTPRGGQEVYLVIILYICMLLGMAAHYAYTRFEEPKRKRSKFDFGLFVAPIFASPIIFIPLLAALQNADIDLTQLTVPKTMVFFVAFENGFFWKEYFDHRRQQKAEGEK